MDRVEAMRVFAKVVERRSFAKAAAELGVPRSTVSDAVKQIEKRVGVRLLQRTTRQVVVTVEGEAHFARCMAILAQLEDAENAFKGGVPGGPLRIDVHGTFGRHFVLPYLSDFLDLYPGIRLTVSEGDRLVDLVAEGIDCVIRVGEPRVSGLVARRIGFLKEGTFASSAYLAARGVPAGPGDLHGHAMIGFHSTSTGEVIPLEFQTPEGVRHVTLPITVTVTAADTMVLLARQGLGLIQVPCYRVAEFLEAGTLLEVLPAFRPTETPVSILYPERRHLAPRVRAFIDWVTTLLEPRLR